MTDVLDRFLEDLAQCDSIDDYRASYNRAVEGLGFSKSAYVSSPFPSYDQVSSDTFSEQMVVSVTYPDEWREVYRDRNFHQIDPVLSESRSRVSPFLWVDLMRSGKLGGAEMEFMNVAHEFGLTNGITVPIHGPRRDFALVSLACDECETEFRRHVEMHKHTLHIFSIYYHEAIQEFAARAARNDQTITLTPRELECLRWTARGKSSWETSVLLNISERTVNFHISNTMRKLSVFNKTHAVAKAVSLGLTEL